MTQTREEFIAACIERGPDEKATEMFRDMLTHMVDTLEPIDFCAHVGSVAGTCFDTMVPVVGVDKTIATMNKVREIFDERFKPECNLIDTMETMERLGKMLVENKTISVDVRSTLVDALLAGILSMKDELEARKAEVTGE